MGVWPCYLPYLFADYKITVYEKGENVLHKTLYRKWRPTTFDEVVGQEHITPILKSEVNNDKITHAYLFSGPRGTGKTSCAKILAKAVNCLSPVNGNPCGVCEACKAIDSGLATDVVEMDAASNNGVEYIRDIRDEVAYSPAMLKYRVYIIDETHMLSSSAFNALLKTLEEPPSYVIFILATTELNKVPATVLSRCQKFEFKRMKASVIADRLRRISNEEDISADENALRLIARLSAGGMRDAISLLELCSGDSRHVDVESVRKNVGMGNRESLVAAANAISDRNIEASFEIIGDLFSSSVDITVFWEELVGFFRDMLVVKCVKDPSSYFELTEEELCDVVSSASKFTKEKLIMCAEELDRALINMQRGGTSKKLCAEMTLVRLCDERLSESMPAIIARISALESGIVPMAKPATVSTAVSDEKKSTKTVKEVKPESDVKSEPETVLEEKDAKSDSAEYVEFADWIEVINRLASEDAVTASVLRRAEAYCSSDKKTFSIRVKDPFTKTVVDNDKVKNLIARMLNAIGGLNNMSGENIIVEKISETKPDDPMNDFLN